MHFLDISTFWGFWVKNWELAYVENDTSDSWNLNPKPPTPHFVPLLISESGVRISNFSIKMHFLAISTFWGFGVKNWELAYAENNTSDSQNLNLRPPTPHFIPLLISESGDRI